MSRYGHRARWDCLAGCSPRCVALIAGYLSLLLLWTHGVGATPVTVQARLTESAIYLGESTTLELRIQGLRQLEPPAFTHADLDVTPAGGQTFSNSSYSMINGQIRQNEEFGYVARYTLRPRRAGSLEIAPLTVVHDGQTYRSNPVTLHVQRPPEQDVLVLTVQADKPSYVLGETVTLRLDMSIRKLSVNGSILEVDPFFREQPPHLQIPWFEGLGDWHTTDLGTFTRPLLGQQRPGFYVNDYRRAGVFQNPFLTFTLPRQSTQRATASGTLAYFTYQLQKQFHPTQAGRQSVPPALVKAHLPMQVDARGRATRTEQFVVSSAPLTIEVRPVPTAGQPASFSGAVGRFHLDVTAHPTMLRVGDPFNVTLTLRGAGLLDTVRAPALEQQPQLAQNFKFQADAPVVNTTPDAKTFTYTLRPRHAGIREVPPVEVAYFDPDTQRFQVLRSAPVPLRVEAASRLDLSEVVDTSGDSPPSVVGQELTAGILANYAGPEALVPQHFQLRIGLVSIVLLASPPLVYGAALVWRWRSRVRQRQPGASRARRAARRALTALHGLRAQQEQGDAGLCEAIHQVLTGYIGDRLQVPGAGLTVDDVVRHLQERQLDPALIEQVATLLHLCDSARYAPGSLAVARFTGLVDAAAALVRQLEASRRW